MPCANAEYMRYGGNTTCVQVKVPGTEELLILDSGSGIRMLGNDLVARPGHVKGRIFITHPHWDHIQGFPFFKPFYSAANQFDIHMPMQANGSCRGVLSGQMVNTYFPITPEMLTARIDYHTQSPYPKDYGAYKVEFMLANHQTNTAIYKFYVDDKIIVFSPDNELGLDGERHRMPFYRQVIDFIRDADILIHDGQYDRASYPERRGWGHSAWEEAVELAIKAGVRHLFLTHHDPDSLDDYLDEREAAIHESYGNRFESVQLAREGQCIHI